MVSMNERLAYCPKDHGAKRVLDMGTGTGIWAIEYGKEISANLPLPKNFWADHLQRTDILRQRSSAST